MLDASVENGSMHDAPKFFRSLSYANPSRNYLGFPFEVQPWFAKSWSWCKAPTAEEKARLVTLPEETKQMIATARFEAVCRINVDGQEIERGLIFSVPRI